MEFRSGIRRFLPALRGRSEPPQMQHKIVLSDYYNALAQAGVYTGYQAKPWPVERAVAEAYERVVYVYKAVEAISGHAAGLPFKLRKGEKEIKDHPLLRVMNKRANPLESARQFRKRLSAQVLLSKKGAFVEVTRARNGDIVRLDLLPPGRTRPVPGNGKDLVSHFELMAIDGTKRDIPPDRIRWFRDPHPLDAYSGVTPLEAAGMSIELDFLTRLFNISFLKNDARPGGVLAINGELDDADMDRIEQKLARGPIEAGKPTVIAGEVTWVDTASAPREMQYEATAANVRKEILTAFGVPESVIGDASGRTFDNAEQEEFNFWSLTMPPHLALIASALDDDIDDDLEFFFDTEGIEVLQRPKIARRAEAREEFAAGLITIDEYRERAGYDPIDNEYTRSLWGNSGKQPIPTSEKDAEKLGLTPAEGDQQAALPPGADASTPAEPGQQPPSEGTGAPTEGTPGGPATAPTSGGGGSAMWSDDQAQQWMSGGSVAAKQLQLPPAPQPELPAPARPAVYARPVLRLVRPAIETKAAPAVSTTESTPNEAAHAKLEAALAAALAALMVRLTARAATRISSPKARKHTRHWVPEHDVDTRIGTKAIDADAAVDPQRWQEETEQTAHPIVEAAAIAAATALLADFAAPPMPNLSDVVAPVVTAIVRLLGESARRQADKLIALLRDADATGTPMSDLTVTARGFAKPMASWADVVAVQAATATVNGGRDAAARAAAAADPNREIIRVWRNRGDAFVRPSHQIAGGQKRDLGEPFEVGRALLLYPGDPDGPIEEIANCRCWLMHRSTVTGRFVPTPPGEVTRAPRAGKKAAA